MRELDVRAGAVTGVVLEDGSRLPADVVMMATGTTPNVEWLQGSGLPVSGGLECGPTLHARGSDRVVGAGDVVRAPQALLDGESLRVEHWASTLAHADLAAANLLAGPGGGATSQRPAHVRHDDPWGADPCGGLPPGRRP